MKTSSEDNGLLPTGAPTRRRLLLVDDEEDIRDLTRSMLEEDGWEISGVTSGAQAIDLLRHKAFDLVLLDLRMPIMDGFEVLRHARTFCSTPIVALSALDSVEDRKRFLGLGGNDYIAKPFTTQELRFRSWAALNKATDHRHVVDIDSNRERPGRLDFDDGYLSIEFANRRVVLMGNEVKVTRTEFDLLHELAANLGKAVSYDDILQAAWGPEYKGDRGRVQGYVNSLRKKIEPDITKPIYITNLPGFGYRFSSQH